MAKVLLKTANRIDWNPTKIPMQAKNYSPDDHDLSSPIHR